MDWFSIISGLLGGLAIFIFGMNMMSEGMQKSAGEKMRVILGFLTKNPLMAVLAGTVVTAVLQSSAATTVMVIGFVSAGLMTLPQAICVVIGANIGTTITGQIIAFDIEDLVWPIIVVGFAMYFFAKKELYKNIGETIFAFGLLFLGIIDMSGVMKPLAASPSFTNMIAKVADTPILGALTGLVMTLIIQSSSAVVAIIQNFAKTPVTGTSVSIIGLQGAIPIIFGTNIGATLPSLIAGLGKGKGKDAKKTALSNLVFNVSLTLLFMFVIPLFCRFVRFISPSGATLDDVSVISRQIANAHSTFNIVGAVIWLPLVGVMIKILDKMVRGSDDVIDESTPKYLDEKILEQPVFAMHLCVNELTRTAEFAQSMIDHARAAVMNKTQEDIDEVDRLEDVVDKLQDAIVRYISNISTQTSLTEQQAVRVASLMHVANDVEHVGDRCIDIIKVVRTMIKKEYDFSEEAHEEIDSSFDIVKEMLENAMKALESEDKKLANMVLEDEDKIDDLEARLRKRHMKRLKKKKCAPNLSVVYTEILHNIERIGDHCKNIAEAVIGDEG
ncbi:MAG: Na/Pi cotransporter family protein [Firmicutes bacterium]|nr:Na/Pi cotransporter family protein [Bacillota bacterium]